MKNKLDSLFFTRLFVSGRKQIALRADEKPPARISHRLFATSRSEMEDIMEIKIENYTKRIKGATVLENINLTLKPGICYGLKGKNGSGKTMLMRAVCGLIRPTSGNVFIDGKVLGKDMSFPESIGVLIENPSFLNNYTGFQNLKLLASIQNRIGDDEIKEMLAAVGLDPEDKRKYRKYSLGMKQKLGIASALMEKPDIIILDEPINALDEEGVARVKGLVEEAKKRGAIVSTACHDSEELMVLSDQLIHISDGRAYMEADMEA